MIRRVVDWLEERTGIETATRNFLYEEIPASAGWHQVFGSVALFLFLLQGFTGILLAFNYAPTPGEAYNSVRYIVMELTGGRMLRGLHHWGASMMIIVVVLHMAQVFLWGAYKKPREATWMLGVVLLLVVLGFGLTGYLLPWDNRAYWGTVVATKIAESAPFAGPYMSRLLGSDGDVGVVTFARFYALHVLILPPLTLILIAIHVYLVRKHGITPAAGDVAPKKKFYPEQVFKDTVAIFIAFAILFVMAVVVRVPLEQMADPTDTAYIPRPDWYFLFLFQTLKFFEGSLEVIGSIVLPTIAIALLFLVPFIDRTVARRVTQRTVAFAVFFLAALGWTGLTVAAIKTTPHSPTIDVTTIAEVQEWQELPPESLAGVGYYRKANCASCHTGAKKLGPEVIRAKNRTAEWLIEHFRNPGAAAGTEAKPSSLTESQTTVLATFVTKLDERTATALEAAPVLAAEGAIIYQQFRCGACHQVNGVGVAMGPAINGVAMRRTRQWLEEHFVDPQKLSPGTPMPPYRFKPAEMERIMAYILSAPLL